MSSTSGSITAFDPKTCKFSTYVSRLRVNFLVNKVKAEDQVLVFIANMGDAMYELLVNLASPSDPTTKTFDEVINILTRHFEPPALEVAERQHFRSRLQKDGESISDFVADIKRLSINCKYGDYLASALRDQLVTGLRSESIKRRLITEVDLNFEKAVKISMQLEVADKEMVCLYTPSTSSSVQKITKSKAYSNPKRIENRKPSLTKNSGISSNTCHQCGSKDHWAPKCRHINTICNNCKKKGHIAKVCRSGKCLQSTNTITKGSIGTILHTSVGSTPDSIMIPVIINSKRIDMELDTGASYSLISRSLWESIGKTAVTKSSIVLRTYNQQVLPVLGSFNAMVTINKKTDKASIIVVRNKSSPALLGRDLLSRFPLDWSLVSKILNPCLKTINSITINDICAQYPTLFSNGLGCVKGVKASIKLRDDAIPRFCKPRPVPYALKAKIEADLERLEKLGVITKVLKSDWAAHIVPVLKSDGSVRICGDFSLTINNAIQSDWYPLPSNEDLFSKLANKKVFSKLDCKDAYLQVELDDKAKEVVVINTHKGLYCYNRVPFGVSFAPGLFQFIMEETVKDLEGVSVFLDDDFIGGEDDNEHNKNLHALLRRLQDRGFKLKKEKCIIGKPSIEYLGHLDSANGIQPLKSKVEAILKAPKPRDVKDLRSFLGLINYYGKFIEKMSTIASPLYELLKEDIQWNWSAKQENAFKQLRQSLTSHSILSHYDSSLPIIIECDPFGYGIGCVLSHRFPNGDVKPISIASKTLSLAERNYSQIEKEALAIIYGVRKFHKYLFGRHFELVTDHKPLNMVLGPKGHIMSVSASRLHRWSTFLQAYKFSISFQPTKQHANCNYLSRYPLPIVDDPCLSKDLFDVSNKIAFIEEIDSCPVDYKKVREETKKDKQLIEVIRHIQSGWPYDKCPNVNIKPFYVHRHMLTYNYGCLLLGLRLIVPQSLRKRILNSLHECNIGIVRMKSIARGYVWWPNIDAAVEEVAKACSQCAQVQASPPKASVHPWSYPERPWQRVHLDLCGPMYGRIWLVIVDAYSKWIEVVHFASMPNLDQVIRSLLSIFARFGLPKKVVSDNGTQFTAGQFKSFCYERGIKQRLSAPHHPASNGEAGRFVRVFKDGMRSFGNIKDWETSVLNFIFSDRTTMNTTTGKTPAELMFGRNIRTNGIYCDIVIDRM